FQHFAHRDLKGCARRFCNFLYSYIPGIMDPHAKVVQQWNKFFVISCLVAIFVDPLFFLLLSVREEFKCIVLNWRMAITIAVVRSVTDLIYAMHMILQFRLAYVAPESRVVGAGDLVGQPKKIALNHHLGCFTKIRGIICCKLCQKSCTSDSSSSLGNQSGIAGETPCLNKDNPHFNYGIYKEAVKITTGRNNIVRYVYSLFWGFQQISTLAGNLVPSDFAWKVLFTMAIVGLGLFLFVLLIGNMQNFLIALGRRRLEMQLRRRDVEQWMDHRRLPEGVKKRVRQSERFSWSATQGINVEILLGNLSEDLQIDIYVGWIRRRPLQSYYD
ncbi:hypothetical protein MKX01_036136, partial [Papaver californicum]